MRSAILFMTYKRYETSVQVFDAIRKAQPPRLYFASNAPNPENNGEQIKVEEVRNLVKKIDWPCDIHTLFREKHLSVKYSISSAIDWFFENEEEGIILEDDVLPTQSFFMFCDELLHRYKKDMRVWHIAGNNFHSGWVRDPVYSYYFSYYGSIWGWATWKTRWQYYDVNISNYEEIKHKGYLKDVLGSQEKLNFRIDSFDAIINGLDTWDYQWFYCRIINHGLSIVPNINFVKNIGFFENSTHTGSINDFRAFMNSGDIEFPLNHPDFMIRDQVSDIKYLNKIAPNDQLLKFKKNIKTWQKKLKRH